MDRVFTNVDGHPLTPATIVNIFRRAVREAGTGERVSPRLFRHTHLTRLLEAGVAVQDVAVFAGHSDVRTIFEYFHQAPGRLREAFDRAASAETIRRPVTGGEEPADWAASEAPVTGQA